MTCDMLYKPQHFQEVRYWQEIFTELIASTTADIARLRILHFRDIKNFKFRILIRYQEGGGGMRYHET